MFSSGVGSLSMGAVGGGGRPCRVIKESMEWCDFLLNFFGRVELWLNMTEEILVLDTGKTGWNW